MDQYISTLLSGSTNNDGKIKKIEYLSTLLSGLTYYGAKIKKIEYLSRGSFGMTFMMIFENNKELVMKTGHHPSLLYETETIRKMGNLKYVCHYYGYNVVKDGKYKFQTNNALQFNGVLPKLHKSVIKHVVYKKFASTRKFDKNYFSIVMERLYFFSSEVFSYDTVNLVAILTFVKCVMNALTELSQKNIIHGDVHMFKNIGFFKANINNETVMLPKLIDFGIHRLSEKIVNSNTYYPLIHFYGFGNYRNECPPEMNGQLDDSFNYDQIKLKNKVYDKHKLYGTNVSDVYMFFNRIILMDFLLIDKVKNKSIKEILSTKYYLVNDEMYVALKFKIQSALSKCTDLNNNVFIDNQSKEKFIDLFTNLIMSTLNPNYKLRPTSDKIVKDLTFFINEYFIESQTYLFRHSDQAYLNQQIKK